MFGFPKLLRLRFVAPDESRQRAVPVNELLRPPRIVDNGLDLAAMADDAHVLEQTIEVALGEACYPVEVETVECCAEVLGLARMVRQLSPH